MSCPFFCLGGGVTPSPVTDPVPSPVQWWVPSSPLTSPVPSPVQGGYPLGLATPHAVHLLRSRRGAFLLLYLKIMRISVFTEGHFRCAFVRGI